MSNEGPRWFEQPPNPIVSEPRSGPPPKDLWSKCPGCDQILYRAVLLEQMAVCPHCGHHHRWDARARLEALIDPGSFVRHDEGVAPVDRLGFVDSKPYGARLNSTQRQQGELDAYIAGSATIEGIPLEVGTFNFRFMGGSMGSVVGELVTRQFERAAGRRVPALVISQSGGARMQEGILSLMQMAKTCAALARLRDEAHMPYVSLLTDPTTGGVAASFAMLGDVIVAEPDALVGFAGPRVIQQTIGEALPEGFQTSEYLLAHGMVDLIVPRPELRATLARLFRLLLP
ncbi:MAG: acetyl-CoA carboxylase, carboxyltransferase subunit beta [Myxococcota bacterium]